MLTSAQITAGVTRLNSGKLSDVDVDQTTSILEMDSFFGSLVKAYGYQFKTKLAEFDDTGNQDQICAQIAACLNKMEELGFGVSELPGSRLDGLKYKEKDEYWQYVQIIFLKMYTMPIELSKFPLGRKPVVSGSVQSQRTEGSMRIHQWGEPALRRGWRGGW